MNKKVLILGAKGNLGPELAEVYKSLKPVLWDREDLNIVGEQLVMKKISDLKPDLVFNCAAYNAVDKAEDEGRQLAENVNGYAVGYLAKACNAVSAIMVHFSTNYVFDGNKKEGYNEDDLPNPISAYGTSKLMGEMELQKNTDKFYLIRSAWLYGPEGKSATSKKTFVDAMMERASKDQVIECVEDQFGQPTYTKDLAQAVAALIEQAQPFGIYHLTNSGEASWYSWADEIFKIKGIKAKLVATSMQDYKLPSHKAARPQYGILNNTKFIELRPWTEALREYLS